MHRNKARQRIVAICGGTGRIADLVGVWESLAVFALLAAAGDRPLNNPRSTAGVAEAGTEVEQTFS
jgi:hypothetical protein